jgi:4-amino-4-deoxy-L-arabinose transferase-like glycosyltransferase
LIVLDSLERPTSPPRSLRGFVWSSSSRRWVFTTVLLALAIRLIVAFCAFHNVANPINTHAEFGFEMGWTARSIALGHGFSGPFQPITGPTAIVPPLYPYLLAGIFRLFGVYSLAAALVVLCLNGLFSALTCIPVYGAAREAAGERLARWAALGWAIYPFAVYYSAARVWDYALTGFLFACCFWWAMRLHAASRAGSWTLFGLLFGLTALSNPSIVTLLPVLLLIAAVRSYRLGLPVLRRLCLAIFAFALVLVPWTLRNYRVLHIAAPLRDGFWLEFYAGNIGDPTNSNSPSAHPASNPAEMALYEKLGETAYMAQKHDLAIETVIHHKRLFAVATMRRAVRFWTGYWSFSPAYLEHEPCDLPNVPFCSVLTLFCAAGLLWGWRHHRARLLPFLCLVALFPIPYYLTHSSMDYRAPIEPQLAILATAGMIALRDRLTAADGALAVPQREMDFVPS